MCWPWAAYCCCSVTKSFLTLCNPMKCRTPGFPVLHYLPEFAQTHVHWSVMPSNHLSLCHSLLFLPSIFPSIRVFSSESALCIRWPKCWRFSLYVNDSISKLSIKCGTSYYWVVVYHILLQSTCCSVTQACLTLCDPMDCSTPAFPVLHNISWSLLKLLSIKLVILSNHLILCHPVLPLSVFPSIRFFSSESALCIKWPKY